MAIYSTEQIQQEHEESESKKAFVFLVAIPNKLIGFAILLSVFIILASLASWSVNDPSLSFSTENKAQNWLGGFGALIADIAFQFYGLMAIFLLLPPVFWAWQLIHKSSLARPGLRLLSWFALSIIGAGFFSFIATPLSWPLPSGLGGLVGEQSLALTSLISGNNTSASIIFAIILLAPTLALMWVAIGFNAKQAPPKINPLEDKRNRTGVFDIIFGAVIHSSYALKTAWRRNFSKNPSKNPKEATSEIYEENLTSSAFSAQREQISPEAQRFAPNPQLAQRVEPSLHANQQPNIEPEINIYEPLEATPIDYNNDHDARLSVESATNNNRISATAPKPKQGNRIANEAQGSLLKEEGFTLPELNLLAEPPAKNIAAEHNPQRLEENARRLEEVLMDFGIKGDIINVRPGPVVTLYELEPAPGIKSSRIISLADDIARSMSAISARVAVVPGRNAIGIELPNQERETVYLREMLASADFEKSKGKLNVCLGKTIGGEPIIVDLARMPHLLIAGTTGSGKSVGINTMILSLLYRLTPDQCKMIMIDPKMLELSIYDGIPHLLTPVVTDPSKAVVALKWAVREMEDRYRKMSKIGVRNIDGFNDRVKKAAAKGEVITRTVQTGFNKETGEAVYESEEFSLEPLPYIVIIVDEMADLMMVAGKDIEGAIQRLAQMARAAGIHLITATQRPSVDVITGTIKANFPTRISFQVTSKIDSRTILGEMGAEQLLGMGDMLYMAGGGRTARLHGPFCSDQEVEHVVNHLKSQGAPDYLENVTQESEEQEQEGGFSDSGEFSGSGNEIYDKAVNIVLNDKKASTSYLQRRLSIGYNRAATLIEQMEQEGIISPANHAGKREILVGDGIDY
jgi:S-DNA-T family DNA segregation ATPase FtsK/SpoIIIE